MNFISTPHCWLHTRLAVSAVALLNSGCATRAAPAPVTAIPPLATIPVAASGQPAAPAAPVPTDLLAVAAERFLTAFRRGDDQAACSQFEPIMASKMPAARLTSVRQKLGQAHGPLPSWTAVETKSLPPYEGRFYRLTFAFGSLIARIIFVPQTQQVTGLFFAADTVFQPPAPAQSPGAEAAISTHDVTIGPNLGATITWPQAIGGAALPAVVLVPGSGVVDRDETVGAARPFRDLAAGLARHGIVTIRYDKRTFARPDLLIANPRATVEDECIQDALAAIALVRWQPRVDPARVFVAGHSLGAMLAPEIATRAGRIAGVIMLAAPARPVLDELIDQLKQADKQRHQPREGNA
ncbi:MAG TPA: alpha/beta fold hydrolase [Polyangia bacterium]|nr:alpha/beta fold hydrolase [Polyangia bacterium]